MAAIRYAFDRPLQPLGLLLPPGIGSHDETVSKLIWQEVYGVTNGDRPITNSRVQQQSVKRELTQAEIVDSLVARSVRSFEEDGHMLSLGYRKAGFGNFETKIGGGAIESRFPNWIVSFLKTAPWEALLSEIGEALMISILWDLPFLALKQGDRILQITGRPLPNVLNEIGREMEDACAQNSETLSLKTTGRVFRNDYKRRGWALPSTYCMNRLQKTKAAISKEQARKLALIIMGQNGGTVKANKNCERTRVGEPWKSALPSLQKLLEQQRYCPYAALFDRARRSFRANSTDENTERVLLSLKRYDTPLEIISRFLKMALLRIVPRAFWGSKLVKRAILRRIESAIVHGSASDPVTWREVLAELDVSSFGWLRSCSNRNVRKRALRSWLEFLFTNLAMAILSAFFFMVRDEQGSIVYYTKRIWKSNVLSDLSQELFQFERISIGQMDEARQRMSKRRFGGPRLRFIKKRKLNDFRLIMNLSYRDPQFPFSANMALRPAFHALTFEVDRDPTLGGSFVSGVDAIYPKYLTYLRKVRTSRGVTVGGLINLSAVALDVRKCFDTMRGPRVLECCERALKEEEYSIATHSLSFADFGMRRVRTRRMKTVKPAYLDVKAMQPDPPANVAGSGGTNRNSKSKRYVVTDTVTRQFVSRSRVLGLIQELVEHTYVTFANQPYRMQQGVPQGSILSTLLCRIYYGAFEKAVVHNMVAPDEDLLMRLVDDFFLLTPDRGRAELFVTEMSKGNDEWGCSINADKTRFVIPSDVNHWIPWCGLLIDVKRGEVRLQYETKDQFSGSRVFQRGVGRTMRAAFAVKCRPLLLDLEINSLTNVFLNIAQMFVVCAARYARFLDYVGIKRPKLIPCTLKLGDVADLFSFAHALIHNRIAYREGLLSQQDVLCLGWAAFAHKFRNDFGVVPEAILQQLEASKFRRRTSVHGWKIKWDKIECGIAYAARQL